MPDSPDDAIGPRRRGRPPGRPRVAEQGSTVSCWVRSDLHDRLVKAALARDVSLSSLVRHLLTRRLPHD
jgi:predicted HicB family RNase H-like nuclease